MFRIEGDGSYQHTSIWKDNKKISYERCDFRVNQEEGCVAIVDDVFGTVDRILINGIYMVISDGKFKNTKLFYMKEMLHGVQWLKVCIKRGSHPTLTIGTILLPNLIELEEEVPLREVDPKLMDDR